jgi:sec-independent protein translocase protein TatA
VSVPGPAELIVIFVVALLVFGPKKLPELSRQLGRGMRELRNLQQTLKGELDHMLEEDDEPAPETGTPAVSPPPPEDTGSPDTRPTSNGRRAGDEAGPEAASTG